MLISKKFRKNLIEASALIAVAVVLQQSPVQAASFTVPPDSIFTKILNGGGTGVVGPTGNITAASTAGVLVNGSALSLDNSGTIIGPQGVYVTGGGNLTGFLHNNAGATIHGAQNGIIITSGDISGGIVNNGDISGTGTDANGIFIQDATAYVNGIDNNGGTISGTGTGAGVKNAGMISVVGGAGANCSSCGAGPGTAGIGISVSNSGVITKGIVSSGEISGYGGNGGTSSGFGGNGGAGGRGAGIDLATSSSVQGIVNNGAGATISGQGGTGGGGYNAGGTGGQGVAINVNNSSISQGIVNNGGTISGLGGAGGGSNGTAAATFGGTGGQGIGISVSNSGTITNGIDNNGGTISGNGGSGGSGGVFVPGVAGQGTGIFVGAGATISGGIHNSGTISGSTHGIDNAGTITNVGANGASCFSCSAAGGSDGFGISLDSVGAIAGGIASAGTISGVGGNGGVANGSPSGSGGGGGQGIGIDLNDTASITQGITIDGTISGQGGNGGGGYTSGGSGGLGVGISMNGTSTIAGNITNNAGGVISGVGGIGGGSNATTYASYGGAGGFGIGISLGNSGTITSGIINAGTISGTGGAGGSGYFGVAAGGQGIGIFVTGGTDLAGGIHNSGTIDGSTFGILISNAKVSGGITNDAGGVIDPPNTAIQMNNLTGLTPITINGGQIVGGVIDNAPGNMFSPVTFGGDFTTQGSFTVSSIAVSTAKTLTVGTGDTLSARSFIFGVQDASTFGKIVMTDTAFALNAPIVANDGQIAVNVAGIGLLSGDQLKIVTGDGSTAVVNGPGATPIAVTDNSALWNFTVADGTGFGGNDTDLFLIVKPPLTCGSLPDTPGNLGACNTLLDISGTTDPQLQQVINNLAAAPNKDKLNDFLDSILPGANGADFAASQEVGDATLGFEEIRLASLRKGEDQGTGMAAGNMTRGLGMWGQVFGQHTDQDERDNVKGYTANTWGGALGVDTRAVSDKAVVGLAFSYGHTDADSDNSNSTDTDVDSYQVSLYGDYTLAKNTWLNAMFGYTWGDVDATRHNVGGIAGLTANGDYNTQTFSARAEVGRDFATSRGVVLTPSVLANWVNWNPDSYTETGAGGANLRVDGDALDKFELGLGLKAGWSLKNKDGSLIKPELRAGYRYALENDNIEQTAQFTGGGGTFLVPGPDPGRNTFDLGASVKFLTTKKWTFTASYDFSWKSDYTSSSGFLRAGYKF